MQFFPKSLFILLFCLIQGFTFDLALSNFDSTNINTCIFRGWKIAQNWKYCLGVLNFKWNKKWNKFQYLNLVTS